MSKWKLWLLRAVVVGAIGGASWEVGRVAVSAHEANVKVLLLEVEKILHGATTCIRRADG